MLRRLTVAAILAVALLSAPTYTGAQVSGVALAALSSGDIFNGFFGPFRPTATGIDLKYVVLCYDTGTRQKAPRLVEVFIPDGSTLTDLRTRSTTAIIEGCAEYGITVPRGAVLLPALQFGQ